MSSFNLDINQGSKNEFPIELIITGKQLYRDFIKLTRTTGGIIILFPLVLFSIFIVPFTYILIGILYTYYSLRMWYFTNKLVKVSVNKSNYKSSYDIFLSTKEAILIIKNFNSTGKHKILLLPLTFFLNIFNNQLLRANKHLEKQLFEVHDPKTIPAEAVDSLKKQLSSIDHDWYDDVLWKDFQVKHHHMAN